MSPRARLLLLVLGAVLALPLARPAFANWASDGTPVANNSGTQSIGYLYDTPGSAVAPDGRGGVFVAYTTNSGDSIRINHIDGITGNRLWGTNGLKVNEGGNGASVPQVLPDSLGGVWIAWLDTGGGTTTVRAQHYDRNGVEMGTAGGFAAMGEIGTAVPGGPVIARGVGSTHLLLAARYTATAGVRVVDIRIQGNGFLPFIGMQAQVSTDLVPASASPLQLFSDGGGGGWIVWPALNSPLAGIGTFGRISANRFASNGAVQWGANGVVVQSSASVALDDMDALSTGTDLYVVWRHTTTTSDGIHAQRLDGSGVLQWGANTTGATVAAFPATAWSNYPGVLAQPRLASDAVTGLWVAWIDARDYNRPAPNGIHHFQDAYVQRLSGTGARQLATAGAPIDTMPGSLEQVRVEATDSGALLVAYRSWLFDNGDIYLARVAFAGTIVWSDWLNKSGSLLLNDNIQTSPVLAADGFGGVFVGWDDNRIAGNPDVYVSHRTSSGGLGGPTLTVTAPNGGETLVPFSTSNLTWTSTQLGDVSSLSNIRLEYAVVGQPRVTITSSTANDGTFAWAVPDLRSNAVKVYASDVTTGTIADSSNAVFSVCSSLALTDSTTLMLGANDVRLADLDFDGALDLVIPNAIGISICRGTGTGSFRPAESVLIGSGGRNVAVEDFDGDGLLDLAVTISNFVSVLRGHGTNGHWDSTFTAAVNYPAGPGARDLVAADFDEDGILDLAVLDGLANTVSILRGNGDNGTGDATFAAPVAYAVGVSPSRLVAGDFNEDGILDLANTNGNATTPSVTVLLGNGSGGKGDGTFAPAVAYPVGSTPIGITSADFDGNGIADLAVSCNSSVGVGVLFGKGTGDVGDGTFGGVSNISIGGNAIDVKASDVDADGKVDLVVISNTLHTAVILHGNGSGTFTTGTPFVAGRAPLMLAMGDVNGDGEVDALCANSSNTNVTVLRGGCPNVGPSQLVLSTPNGGEFLSVGNATTVLHTRSDNIPLVDVEVSRDDGAHWRPLVRNAMGKLFTWDVAPPVTGAARLRVVDAQRRGVSDATNASFVVATHGILVTHPSGGTVTAFAPDTIRWITPGTPTVSLSYRIGNGPARPIASNVPGTGAFAWMPPDTQVTNLRVIVASTSPAAADTSAEDVAICERFDPAILLPSGGFPYDVAAADFDGDGIEDLVAATNPGVDVHLGLGSGGIGNGTFAPPVAYPTEQAATRLALGDLNEDGRPDVVTNSASGFQVLLDTSGGVLGTATGFGNADTTLDVAIGDADLDGIEDVFASEPGTSRIETRFGTGQNGVGDGGFGGQAVLSCPIAPGRICVVDVDQDGDLDVIATQKSTGAVMVALGGFTGSNHHYVPGAGGTTVYDLTHLLGAPTIADFDGDGVLDIAVSTTNMLRILPGLAVNGHPMGIFGLPTDGLLPNVLGDELAVADLNGDALPDLVANTADGGRGLRGMLNRGGFVFEYVGEAFTGLPTVRGLLLSDFNRDGSPDVVLGGAATPGLALLAGDPCTSFSRFVSFTPPAPGAVTGASPAAAATTWAVDETHALTWTKSPNVFLVDLQASRNGGATWETIARDVPGTSFAWTVTRPATSSLTFRARDAASTLTSAPTVTPVVVTDPVAGVGDALPVSVAFSAAWPNPSHGDVRFELGLPRAQAVDVTVYDVAGREVGVLARGVLPAGRHALCWDAGHGSAPAGVYLVRARTEGLDAVRRIVRVR